jgi:hypothetical protein
MDGQKDEVGFSILKVLNGSGLQQHRLEAQVISMSACMNENQIEDESVTTILQQQTAITVHVGSEVTFVQEIEV